MFELDLEGYEMSGKARIFNFYLIIKKSIYLRAYIHLFH